MKLSAGPVLFEQFPDGLDPFGDVQRRQEATVVVPRQAVTSWSDGHL